MIKYDEAGAEKLEGVLRTMKRTDITSNGSKFNSMDLTQEDLFAALPDTGAVTLTGFETEDAECVGAGADLKLPLLLKNKCSLALLGPDWADSRITGADGENAFLREDLDDEQAKALRSVCEALGEYAIPAFVDRSGEEPTQEGRAVWAAVYEKLLVPARDVEEKN